MASEDRPGISPGSGVRARPRHLQVVRARYDRVLPQVSAAGGAQTKSSKAPARPAPRTAELLGCRPYRRGRRGWRRMRSFQSPDTLLLVPPRSDREVAHPPAAPTVIGVIGNAWQP